MSISRILYPIAVTKGWQLFISPRHYWRDPAVYPKLIKANNLVWGRTLQISFCLTLHQVGFALSRKAGSRSSRDRRCYHRRGRLLPCLFTLMAPEAPRYLFCGTFRVPIKWGPRELPGTLFCGVRTFLYSRRNSLNGNCPTWTIYCSSASYLLFNN